MVTINVSTLTYSNDPLFPGYVQMAYVVIYGPPPTSRVLRDYLTPLRSPRTKPSPPPLLLLYQTQTLNLHGQGISQSRKVLPDCLPSLSNHLLMSTSLCTTRVVGEPSPTWQPYLFYRPFRCISVSCPLNDYPYVSCVVGSTHSLLVGFFLDFLQPVSTNLFTPTVVTPLGDPLVKTFISYQLSQLTMSFVSIGPFQ